MAKMKVALVPKAGADLKSSSVKFPIHLRVTCAFACRLAASVTATASQGRHASRHCLPARSGHEVAGVIDETVPASRCGKKGQRVGVGWNAGHDGTCDSCGAAIFALCANGKISGVSYDGGYAEYMIAPAEALARIPESLKSIDAAPLLAPESQHLTLCATVGRARRFSRVFGMAASATWVWQFANKFGYYVAAISRGKKTPSWQKSSALISISIVPPQMPLLSSQTGRCTRILATVPSSKAMSSVMGDWDQTENCWWWERTWKTSACPQ